MRLEQWQYDEMYPNAGIPKEYYPDIRLVNDTVYYYTDMPYTGEEPGWKPDSGGINNMASVQYGISVYEVEVEGELKQIFQDDRPDNVEIPEPQPFTLYLLYQGESIEVPGTIFYTLNGDYDPKAFAKGVDACNAWNATTNPISMIFLYFPYIIVGIVGLFVVFFIYKRVKN